MILGFFGALLFVAAKRCWNNIIPIKDQWLHEDVPPPSLKERSCVF